jgi:translation initiation factor 2 subunit 1
MPIPPSLPPPSPEQSKTTPASEEVEKADYTVPIDAVKEVESDRHQTRQSCRFYENEYPDIDQYVMVNVQSIAEMGAYVSLLEYNNKDGMILLSELSRRRIRSIPKLIRVGKNEVVMVLRVDKEKGYIDLSKRRVSPEDITKTEDKFAQSKTVHGILANVAETHHLVLEDLYRRVGWPLYKKFGHAYAALKAAIADPDKVFEGLDIDKQIRDDIMKNVLRRMAPQAIKIRADVEVTCFTYEGIEAIRTALRAGEACSTDECAVKIKLIAPPLYVMFTSSMDKDKGIAVLTSAIEVVKAKIGEMGGNIDVKMKPRATSERDDEQLSHLLEKLEKEAAEEDEDDDGEDGEDGDELDGEDKDKKGEEDLEEGEEGDDVDFEQ